MTFLIFKMDLTTLTAQTVSTLKAKLFKVIIKFKNGVLLNFRPFFLIMYIFEVATFFLAYNHFHNILRLFDALPNFPFTTSEMMRIIIYNHGIYELPHELPSNLKLRILGN